MLTQGQLAARLVQPAAITVRGQNLAIDSLPLDVGGGRITASGKVEDTLDLNVAIKALPLAIANTIKPDLRLGGTLDGSGKDRRHARQAGHQLQHPGQDSWPQRRSARRG